MKLRERFTAWILVGVMALSSVQFPVNSVYAKEAETGTEEGISEIDNGYETGYETNDSPETDAISDDVSDASEYETEYSEMSSSSLQILTADEGEEEKINSTTEMYSKTEKAESDVEDTCEQSDTEIKEADSTIGPVVHTSYETIVVGETTVLTMPWTLSGASLLGRGCYNQFPSKLTLNEYWWSGGTCYARVTGKDIGVSTVHPTFDYSTKGNSTGKLTYTQYKVTVKSPYFKVYFNANGGECGTGSMDVCWGKAYSYYGNPLPIPVKQGYVFDGWYSEASGGNKIENNTIFKSKKDVTLYAHWRSNKIYVYFEPNGGQTSIEYKQVVHGQTYGALPTPVREGYTFKNWYTQEKYGTPVLSNTKVEETKDHVIYAHWTKNEGTTENGHLLTKVNGKLPTCSEKGYETYWVCATCKKMFSDADALHIIDKPAEIPTVEHVWDDGMITVKPTYTSPGERTYTCIHCGKTKVEEIEKLDQEIVFSVTFDLQGHGVEIQEYSEYTDIAKGEKVRKPADPKEEGYRFLGWYKDAACTDLWNFDTDTVESDITLYAKWEKIEEEPVRRSYAVIFDLQGHETEISFLPEEYAGYKVEAGSRIKEPQRPQAEGYRFLGWYKDAACTDLWNFDADTVESDITLYAKWEKIEEKPDRKSYTVTFDLQGHGTVLEEYAGYTDILQGSTIDKPTSPGAEGYTFTGWYRDSACTVLWNFDVDTIESDTILYAGWKKSADDITEDMGDILPEDIPVDGKIPSGLWIAGVKDYIYTGKAIRPEVRVYDSNKLLKSGQDYTISYKNNTRANDASKESAAPVIVVRGKGNYTGTERETFKILPLDLNDASVTTEDITVAFNNKIQKKIPIVTYNGKKLVNNKDFAVSYPDKGIGAYKAAGTYTILLSARHGGNFTGTRTAKFTITNNIPISGAVVQKIPDQTYTGKAIEPKLEVKMRKASLVKNIDYTVAYENNTDVGTATAILTGIGDYAGTKKVTFRITGTSLESAEVSGITDTIYNGSAQKQKITVTLNNKQLKEKRDYEVVYSQNINAGKATVTIKGIKAYSGMIKKTFNIAAYDMQENAGSKIGGLKRQMTAKYVKGGSRPELELTFAGKKLIEGTDYIVTCQNNKTVTTSGVKEKPSITIKGRGNFKGSLTRTFTITGKALNDIQSPVTMTVADKGFTGKAGNYISAPVLIDSDGRKLAAGKDYESAVLYTLEDGTELTKNSKVDAGTKIKVIVTGKGAYTGQLEGIYKITQNDFSKAKVRISPQTYTGKAVALDKDSVTVTIGKETLIFGTDYEIVEKSYANNVKKGTGSVTIVGKGNYGGTKTVKFRITAKKFSWCQR